MTKELQVIHRLIKNINLDQIKKNLKLYEDTLYNLIHKLYEEIDKLKLDLNVAMIELGIILEGNLNEKIARIN